MGIPSYYRKLKDSVPGLVFKTKSSATYGLYFDFNCLVYHVLHKDTIVPYPGEDGRIKWENILIEEVVKYVLKIVGLVKPTNEVVICVDGVVPFAKMKQQRLRRFKSALTASSDVWDRNSITPGTYFMERLGARLNKLASTSTSSVHWTVQDASVPGEGEQKIMGYLRKNVPADTNIVIYGLDADLIVLSLLLLQTKPNITVSLFRENVEFGKMVYDSLGQETYTFMDINLLEKYIVRKLGLENKNKTIYNYTMAMSFLGNDFLPHGLAQKMSDEGHDVLLEVLGQLFQEKKTLINDDTSWNIDGVRFLLQKLSLTEDGDILRNVKKKLGHRPPITAETTPDFYPAEKVEGVFFEDGLGGGLVKGSRMKPTWKHTYYEHYCGNGGHPLLAARTAVYHYFEGLHWIRSYYLGEDSVAPDWYYPFFLPPLWKDLLMYLNTSFAEAQAITRFTSGSVPLPQEQLTMVLPLESWWLIRDRILKQLPYKAPQYWPQKYNLFSCGKKWMWECETQIPLLTLLNLRRFILA